MNISRACPWILAGWLLICVSSATAGTRLAESTFQDWTGEVSEAVLPDGSVLFEYTSRTFSGRVEGAMLALSFIPRFHCAPLFNVRLRGSEESAVNEPIVEVSFGDAVQTFPGFVDSLEGFLLYSIMASVDEMDELRRMLDDSPRATINLSSLATRSALDAQSEAATPAETSDSIVFSLLGSKLATRAAQAHCESHEPVAFQPR